MMVNQDNQLVVKSEAEAWALLELARSGDLPMDQGARVVFEGWPSLTIHYKVGSAEITPGVMKGFLELQEAIYRAHRLVRSNSNDIRGLSAEDREAFEIRVKVTRGSSIAAADLTEVLSRLGLEVVTKMDPITLTVTVLGMALVVGGSLGWKQWLEYKIKVKQAELAVDEKSIALENQTELLKTFGEQAKDHQDTMRALILENPNVRQFAADADEMREAFVKNLPRDANVVDIGGGQIDVEAGREITKGRRSRTETVTREVACRVKRLDKTGAAGVRVRLEYADGSGEITAGFNDRMLSDEIINRLDNAFWHGRAVVCAIEFKMSGPRLLEATVIDVELKDAAAE